MTGSLALVATLIPVFLVAGHLDRRLLRRTSRFRSTARMHMALLVMAVAGSLVAAMCHVLSEAGSPDQPSWIGTVGILFGFMGLGTAAASLVAVGHMALFDEPHPDRLKEERRKLEQALARISRMEQEQAARERDDQDDSGSNA